MSCFCELESVEISIKPLYFHIPFFFFGLPACLFLCSRATDRFEARGDWLGSDETEELNKRVCVCVYLCPGHLCTVDAGECVTEVVCLIDDDHLILQLDAGGPSCPSMQQRLVGQHHQLGGEEGRSEEGRCVCVCVCVPVQQVWPCGCCSTDRCVCVCV